MKIINIIVPLMTAVILTGCREANIQNSDNNDDIINSNYVTD